MHDLTNSTINMENKSPEENSLLLSKRHRKRRTIKINTVMGESFDLKVRDSDSIYTVKERIASVIDIPTHLQSLVYNGKELKDDQARLVNLRISDGSSLMLVQKIQTGLVDNVPADMPYRQSFKSEVQQMELHGKAILEKLSEVPELKHMLSDQATIFEVFPDENGFQVLVRTTEAPASAVSTAADAAQVQTDLTIDLGEEETAVESGDVDALDTIEALVSAEKDSGSEVNDSAELTEAEAFKQELLRARKAAFGTLGTLGTIGSSSKVNPATELLSDRLFDEPDIDLTVVRKMFSEGDEKKVDVSSAKAAEVAKEAKKTEDINTRDKMAELRERMAQRKMKNKRKGVDVSGKTSDTSDKKMKYTAVSKDCERSRKVEIDCKPVQERTLCEAPTIKDESAAVVPEVHSGAIPDSRALVVEKDARTDESKEHDTSVKVQRLSNITSSSTNRCDCCSAKLPLVRYACKCERFFCSLHKQDHACTHTYP